ncbi:HAMP domain-containing histidine kinase, partial [bacterium]|nr:HAMP domain-containing histidine kinase [bacterium]
MFDFIKNLFVKEEEEDLLTKLPDNVVLLNNQGSFLWYNDLAQKNFNDIKDNFSEGYIDDIFENAMDLIVKIANKETTKILRTKSSLEKDLFFEVSAKSTNDGYLAIFRNNTQNYKTLTSILVEHESSKKVNKDKNNFLVKMAGEFRTPLQSVIGFSKAILDGLTGDLNEKQEKYINIINKNSEDVLSLFNKILDLSKSESNLFEHKMSYFDAVNVLNNAIKIYNDEINSKNLKIIIDVASDIKRTIYSDEELLKIILQNIIETAVFSTDVGEITINVKHPELELVNEKGLVPFENANEKSFLMISIKDMG